MSSIAIIWRLSSLALLPLIVASWERGADAGTLPSGLRLHPLGRAPSVSVAPKGAAHASDARDRALASALRQALDDAGQRSRSRARAARRVDRLEADGVEVRWRAGVGTPMLIRGAVLQPAAGGGGGGARRRRRRPRATFSAPHRDCCASTIPTSELVDGRARLDDSGRRHLWFAQSYARLAGVAGRARSPSRPRRATSICSTAPSSRRRRHRSPAAIDSGIGRRARTPRGPPTRGEAQVRTPELIVYAPVDRTARLAWKVEVTASLAERWLVLVDATDGAIARLDRSRSTRRTSSAPGSTSSASSGRSTSSSRAARSSSSTRASRCSIRVSTPPAPETTIGGIVILDAATASPTQPGGSRLAQITSNNARSWSPRDGVSASFGLSETYDYYLERHARDSLDGRGGTMLGIVRFGRELPERVLERHGDGLRRRPTVCRRARRRGPRADARRDAVQRQPHLPEPIRGAERGVLRHLRRDGRGAHQGRARLAEGRRPRPARSRTTPTPDRWRSSRARGAATRRR